MVLGLVLAFLAGAAGAWWWQSRTVDELDERLAAAQEQLAGLVGETSPAEAPEATPTADPGAESGGGSEAGAADGDGGGGAPVVETSAALVVGSRSTGGTAYVTVDYVLFLTGEEASDASAGHGGEVPPPNDYYVVNDNPLLREFPVDDGTGVRVVANGDGTVTPEGYDITLADWLAAITGPSAGEYLSTFYWLTITDGVVTAVEQQYLP